MTAPAKPGPPKAPADLPRLVTLLDNVAAVCDWTAHTLHEGLRGDYGPDRPRLREGLNDVTQAIDNLLVFVTAHREELNRP